MIRVLYVLIDRIYWDRLISSLPSSRLYVYWLAKTWIVNNNRLVCLSVCLILIEKFWSLHWTREWTMAVGRMWENESDLWTTFRPPMRACVHADRHKRARGKERRCEQSVYTRTYAHMRSRRVTEDRQQRMDRWTDSRTNGSSTNSLSLSLLLSCVFNVHWYFDSMGEYIGGRAREERERESR